MNACLYQGDVVHRRLRPVRHELRYRVWNLFADIDELPALSKRLRLFSYNRFNLFSVMDRNHGKGDGTPLRDHVWQLARQCETQSPVKRIFMFCYPSILGYVFNPLTVYYGFDEDDALQLMIYEVNNTFGERHSYVIPVDGALRQHCGKRFYVSPFNRVEGEYDFTFNTPGEDLKLAVALSTGEGPCLSAWFTGTRRSLDDASLLRSFASLPLMPIKVIGGIHWEAAKLWLKGLRLQKRPLPPDPPVSFAGEKSEHI